MKKNYNYTRRKLYLPEYGRHIQKMVNTLLEIEDRTERTRQAKAVIAVMGNLNPLLRDTAEFTHKLWDHLFIMSDFQLDVDSPYALPTRESLMIKPRCMAYPQSKIAYRHYGKYVARMLQTLTRSDDSEAVQHSIDNIARYMRIKSFEYNLDHPNNEVIIKDIKAMTGNGIKLDEEALNMLRNDYKNNHQQHAAHQNGKRAMQKTKGKQSHTATKGHHRSATTQHNTQR